VEKEESLQEFIKELIEEGESLVPKGGSQSGGYNNALQAEYVTWRHKALAALHRLGPIANSIRWEIESAYQGSYFYTTSAQGVLGGLKAALEIIHSPALASQAARSATSERKVLISWSGDPSHRVALALHTWLPTVIDGIVPYVSSVNIPKGTRWFSELSRQLEVTSFGIICLTLSNQHESWINFEAGAISKKVDESRISPFLFGLSPLDLTGPLQLFQATTTEREDVYRLVVSLAESSGIQVTPASLRNKFDISWPWLEAALKRIPSEEPMHSNPAPFVTPSIDSEQLQLLTILGQLGGSRVALFELEPRSQLSTLRFRHALEALRDLDLVDVFNALPEGSAASLTRQGRQILFDRGLA
jgi:hypothetical protein